MKKNLIIPFLLLLCVSITAARRSLLQVSFGNGSHVVYSTDDGMLISQGFDAETSKYILMLSTDNESVTYEMGDVQTLEFLPASTGIEDVGVGNGTDIAPAFSFSDKRVVISGKNVTDIAVYAMDGTRCNANIRKSADAVTVDLSSLSAGNYIVKTSVNSIKIRIR